jgi:KaiC/GvpD/RAD55 family RecA-like ATPase
MSIETFGPRPPSRKARHSRPTVQQVSTVDCRPVEWYWPLRLARGKVTLLVGDPGVGKSCVWMDIVARASLGASWPTGSAIPGGATASIILSAEDAIDDTIKPRLEAAGADTTKIYAVPTVRDSLAHEDRLVTLDRDVAALEEAIHDTHASLFVIDPVGAYLPPTLDAKMDHTVRSVLRPLIDMAERTNATCILVMHLTKDSSKKVMHRVLGSVGFIGAARFALAVAEDPDQPERRLLLPVKSNNGPAADTLAFQLQPMVLDSPKGDIDTVRVAWDSTPIHGLTADSVFRAGGEDRSDVHDATDLIATLLAEDTWPLDAKVALEAATAHGIPERTMRKAALKAGIGITRIGGIGAKGRWIWKHP